MNPSRLRYPVVLFDLDGTLLDTVPFILESHQHAWIAHTGRPHDPGRILATIGIPLERSYDDADPALRAAMQATYLAYNKAGNDTHIGIFTGVPRMLDGLARLGVRTGLVTSKRREITERCLRLFDLQDRFGLVVCKEDTARHKPHPDPIHHAMERLGETDPTRVLYVGDSVHDLQAARNAGCPGAMVGWSRIDVHLLDAASGEWNVVAEGVEAQSSFHVVGEGADHCTRGACAPHFNLGFRAQSSETSETRFQSEVRCRAGEWTAKRSWRAAIPGSTPSRACSAMT